MGRRKDPNKKSRVEQIRESLDAQKEVPAVQSQPETEDESQIREEFRQYWAMNRRLYGKARDMEEVLWAHLKAAGFDKPEKFQAGIDHFGLKK